MTPVQPILDPYELGRSPPRFSAAGVVPDTDTRTRDTAHCTQALKVLHEGSRASSADPTGSTRSTGSTSSALPRQSTESTETGPAHSTRTTRATRATRAWRPTWDELFP
jgi:hypothetical protein